MQDNPKHRQVEAIPVEMQGRQMVVLRDPLSNQGNVVVISPEAFMVYGLCDGERNIRQIQVEVARRTGKLVMQDDIKSIIQRLDEHLLMDSDNYRQHLRERLEEYRRAAARPATHAGAAYPADPAELTAHLGLLVSDAKAPEAINGRVRGVIAPHIDLQRGGQVYASTYRAMGDADMEATRFVVLGIVHVPCEAPMILTRLPFATPLGTTTADNAFIDTVVESCEVDVLAEELMHATEHSVEFTVVFLQHLCGPDVTVVPVLCNTFEDYLEEGQSPMESPPIRSCIEALRGAVESAEGETCIVAAADLSHIGRQFGDSRTITPAFLEWAESKDRRLLDACAAGDVEEFHRQLMLDGNATHVCGGPAIYTMLSLILGARGTLIDYGQAVTRETESAVTFAGMLLTT